jgi:hypothetical protein
MKWFVEIILKRGEKKIKILKGHKNSKYLLSLILLNYCLGM